MFVENYFLLFLIFILGASISSFISVYVERGSVVGRSICTSCLRKLNFFELIPVISYFFLNGKCRTCKTKIPSKLFIGEIILGIWFLFSYLYFFNIERSEELFVTQTILVWLLGSVFYLLCLEDLENMEVTSKFIYLLLALGILKVILSFIGALSPSFLKEGLGVFFVWDLLVPLLIISPFWLIYFINKNWIGEADPYVFTSLGLFFGTQFSISLFLYSVWFGAAYGIIYLIFINRKIERNIPVPFLPIIFFSTLFILIFNYHFIKISDILLFNEIFSIYFS